MNRARKKSAGDKSQWGMRQYVGLPLAFVFLMVFGFAPILPGEDRPAQQCLGILLCAATLWASEAIPLFITGMLIPVLAVWFQVLLTEEGERVDRKAASGEIVGKMLSSTIYLALAGFTMTAALKKVGLDKKIANVTLSKAAKLGNFPFMVILSALCILMSAVVSNVTAPVLVLGFLEPYFKRLPAKSPLKRCLASVVMISSNLGGMTTPIASPQNIVSMNEMSKAGLNINFGTFSICGIISAVLCCAVGLVLDRFAFFGFGRNRHMEQIKDIVEAMNNDDVDDSALEDEPLLPVEPAANKGTKAKTIITAVLSCTALVLWIVVGFFEPYMGDNGIISLFVIFLFYVTGMMRQEDFKDSIPWPVIFLLMGGNALGHAVQSSHLLELIISVLNSMEGVSEYAIVLVLLLIVGVIATFVSHTVTSIILMPIVIDFCVSMEYANTSGVAMTMALMCSGSMGLPVSSFPNTTMSGLLDKDGTKVLPIADMVMIGGTLSFSNMLVLGCVCYFIFSAIL